MRKFGIFTVLVGLSFYLSCAGNGSGLDENGNPIDVATQEGLDTNQPPSDLPPGLGDNGGLTPTPTPTATPVPLTPFEQIQLTIFDAYCIKCPSGPDAPKGLHLDSANSYNNLVNVRSEEEGSLKRVLPGDPDNSYLIVKLVPSDPRRKDARMPRDGPPYLTDAEIQFIRDWIASGAPR